MHERRERHQERIVEIARDGKVARGEIVRTARVGKTGYKERGQHASVGGFEVCNKCL